MCKLYLIMFINFIIFMIKLVVIVLHIVKLDNLSLDTLCDKVL